MLVAKISFCANGELKRLKGFQTFCEPKIKVRFLKYRYGLAQAGSNEIMWTPENFSPLFSLSLPKARTHARTFHSFSHSLFLACAHCTNIHTYFFSLSLLHKFTRAYNLVFVLNSWQQNNKYSNHFFHHTHTHTHTNTSPTTSTFKHQETHIVNAWTNSI